MKKLMLITCLLTCSLILKSQTFTSNKISIWNPERNVMVTNDQGNVLFIVPRNFKRNAMLKTKVKILEVGDEKLLIKKEKKGKQNVYSQDWELIAKMDKNGKSILFVKNQKLFKLKEDDKWFSSPKIIYSNEKEEKVIHCTTKDRKYSIESLVEKNEQTDLLMALSLHQLLEAKARKTASEDLLLDLN